jgi:hypothetical protein
MDLHAWITQQVDRAERIAQAADPLLGNLISQVEYVDAEVRADGQHIDSHLPAAVLRRCEADRRILARHRLKPAAANTTHAAACDGCGVEWVQDYCEPITENLNDCPELLDLAHAHGITPEILASLDRPQPPEPQPRDGRRLGLGNILATPPITTSDVPAALRGPNWKP